MPDKSANLSSANMSQPQDWKLIVEKDVPIKLRDGAIIYCDVLRPDCKEKVPALMNIGPYQKDKLWRPPADLEEKANPYLNWETANPLWWCPRGYALIMSIHAVRENLPACPIRIPTRKAWIFTMPSNGLLSCPGVLATSVRWACHTTPTASGAPPTCSRRH